MQAKETIYKELKYIVLKNIFVEYILWKIKKQSRRSIILGLESKKRPDLPVNLQNTIPYDNIENLKNT